MQHIDGRNKIANYEETLMLQWTSWILLAHVNGFDKPPPKRNAIFLAI